MKPPPMLHEGPQPSRGPVLLAKMACWLVVAMNAEVFIVSIILAQVSTKIDGVFWGSLIFGVPVIAPLVALLALPAARRYPGLIYPRVTLALGLAPFPLMFIAGRLTYSLGL